MTEQAVIFKDIEHTTHLAENEHTRALCLHILQQLVQYDHLARVLDQVLVCRVWRARLCAVEQVRVAGDLAELHDDVHQPRLAFLLAREP